MPIYVYELDIDDEDKQDRFEIFQQMTEDALTHHPETGAKVRRVITAPYVPKVYSSGSVDKTLSDKNLDRLGFTKYVKTSSGYEKRAGSGPEKMGEQPGQQ